MRRKAFILLLSLVVATSHAADVYVRDGASGAANGANWTDAYTTFPSMANITRGDTVWFADTSSALTVPTLNKAASGSTLITLKKATIANHGTSTGWLDSYGDGQCVFNSTISLGTPYWVIDGQTRNDSAWLTGTSYGFKIAVNSLGTQIETSDFDVDFITLKYIWLEGQPPPLPVESVVWYSIYFYDGDWDAFFANHIVSHCLFTGGNVPIFTRLNHGFLLEYSAFDTNDSNGNNHGESVSAYFGCNNWTVKFNLFKAQKGTACLAFTGDDWKIYGNVMWNTECGDGVLSCFGGGDTGHNNLFYNNTIVDGTGFNNGVNYFAGGTGNLTYNNLWIGNSTVYHANAVTDYNGYSESDDQGEANAQIDIPTSIFNNYAGDVFTLASNTDAGTILGSPYNIDMNGLTRITWSRGAFEFVSATTYITNFNANQVTVGSMIQL